MVFITIQNLVGIHTVVFGQPFVKRFALCYWTIVLSVCLSRLSVCNIGVFLPNGCIYEDETRHGGRLRPGDIVSDGDLKKALPQSGTIPQFSTHVCCGERAGRIKTPQSMEVGLSPGNIDSAPPKRG